MAPTIGEVQEGGSRAQRRDGRVAIVRRTALGRKEVPRRPATAGFVIDMRRE